MSEKGRNFLSVQADDHSDGVTIGKVVVGLGGTVEFSLLVRPDGEIKSAQFMGYFHDEESRDSASAALIRNEFDVRVGSVLPSAE